MTGAAVGLIGCALLQGAGHFTVLLESATGASEVGGGPGAVVELDLRGSVCPGPTADTLAALKRLPPGGRLAVVTDYLPARQTIPRLVEQRGCTWEITEDDGDTFRMEIAKGGE